ncbi:MAG: HisA/HisF-related TIM barrel protein, partial [Gemmatimonadota bacterium]
LLDAGARQVVVGLETLPSFDALESIASAVGTEALVFSLDVKRETVVAGAPELAARDPLDLAARAYERGIRSLLVLDLARIGAEVGPPLALATSVQARLPEARVTLGGGVRDGVDLERCARAGLAAALVASALHAGRVTPEHLRR